MLNHIVLMGRLTRDPELRFTGGDIPVASFRIAVERDFGKGENRERAADFIDIVAWRQTGEFVSKHFTKGSMAVVSGRLQMREWTDRDGNKRTSAEVVADSVYFGESKKESARETVKDAIPIDYEKPKDRMPEISRQSPFQSVLEDDGELPF